MSAIIRKRIGEFLILLIYLVIDAFEIWPHSHGWALLAVVIGIVALMLLDGEFSYKLIAAVSAISCLGAGVIYWIVGPAEVPPIIGWLQPANEPTPPNGCDDLPANRRPKGKPVIIIGDSGFIPLNPISYAAIQIGSCAPMTIQQGPNGVMVSTDIYSRQGNLAGRIQNNRYTMAGDKNLIVEKSGDLSALVVHDAYATELLYIRYLNPSTIRLRGVFSCPLPRPQTVVVLNDRIITPGNNTFSSGCTVGGAGGIEIK